jgi:preprotein translocase subunit YajC
MNAFLLLTAQMPLFAQTQAPGPRSNAMAFMFPALLMALVVFMLLSARSQKKREQRERDAMHSNLAKNNRVLTIGGVIGTIISVKDNEVVLKVDETTNTKMTFLKTAVQRVITDDQQLSAEKKR